MASSGSSPSPEQAAQLAALAVDHALDGDNVVLDYTSASLCKVEAILGRLRSEGIGAEQAEAPLLELGCYLGEMFVRSANGRWRDTADTPLKGMAAVPLVVELEDGDYCNPLGRVRKCFECGAGLRPFWEAFAPTGAVEDEARRSWWRRHFGP